MTYRSIDAIIKSFWFPIVIVFLFVSCHNVEKSFWPNGNIKSELSYRGDMLHGKATWYFADGTKKYEVNYIKNNLEGMAIRWYANGKKQSEEFYKNNMLNGPSIEWNTYGFKTLEKHYRNDTLHGLYKIWYNNRQIQISGQYYKGLYDGKWLYYDTYGNIVGEGNYTSGSGEQKAWDAQGNLIRRIQYKNNKKHGKEIFYKQGEIMKVIRYKNGNMAEFQNELTDE